MSEVKEIHDFYVGKDFIETVTGDLFYMSKPTFDIEAIAYALAKNCRFNGHSSIMFTVAQHSVLVMEIMERQNKYDMACWQGDPLEGLLHDATEAYLTDIPAPFKHLLPDFRAVDGQLETTLREHFKLPSKKTFACQRADWIALFLEADVHMRSRGTIFVDPHGYRDLALNHPTYRDLRDQVREQGWRDVAENFKRQYERLMDARRSAVA